MPPCSSSCPRLQQMLCRALRRLQLLQRRCSRMRMQHQPPARQQTLQTQRCSRQSKLQKRCQPQQPQRKTRLGGRMMHGRGMQVCLDRHLVRVTPPQVAENIWSLNQVSHKHCKNRSGGTVTDVWEEEQLPAESQGSTPLQPVDADSGAGTAAASEAEPHGQEGDQAANAGTPDGWSPDDDGWQVYCLPSPTLCHSICA